MLTLRAGLVVVAGFVYSFNTQPARGAVSSFVGSSAQHRGMMPNLMAMKNKNCQSRNLNQAAGVLILVNQGAMRCVVQTAKVLLISISPFFHYLLLPQCRPTMKSQLHNSLLRYAMSFSFCIIMLRVDYTFLSLSHVILVKSHTTFSIFIFLLNFFPFCVLSVLLVFLSCASQQPTHESHSVCWRNYSQAAQGEKRFFQVRLSAGLWKYFCPWLWIACSCLGVFASVLVTVWMSRNGESCTSVVCMHGLEAA